MIETLVCLGCRGRGREHALIPQCRVFGAQARRGWREKRNEKGETWWVSPLGERVDNVQA